jgi:outer membrane protein assembly factor BamA
VATVAPADYGQSFQPNDHHAPGTGSPGAGRRESPAASRADAPELRAAGGMGLTLPERSARAGGLPAPAGPVAAALVILALQMLHGAPARGQPQDVFEKEPVEEEIPDPERLEEMGVRIGKIVLLKENVFDTSNPKENRFLYRLANRWHIVTHDSVIRQQLLFREGDRFSKRLMQESARLLRSKDFLYTAEVEPLHYEDGVVDLAIRTRDLWTLMPAFSVSRSGGENKTRVSLSESNLLGRGGKLGVSYVDDVDRESTSFSYSDENLGHSWLSLAAGIADRSDGQSANLKLIRPFYALDARWTAGFEFLDDDREERLYELGEEVAEYSHSMDYVSVVGGWSAGLQDGWVRRWTAGFVYDSQQYGEVAEPELLPVSPEDRRLVYPFIGLEILEDYYATTANRDQIARTEDFYLGRRLAATLGYASETFGSDRDSVVYTLEGSRGFGDINKKAAIVFAEASGRIDDGSTANSVYELGFRYYNQITAKRLFFMTLDGRIGHDLDLDNPIELGGDNGLRGYPLRYQAGDASLLLTVEQRYFTDWYPFRLVRVGGAVFADVGRTWGDNPVGGHSLGWLKDIGFGLRFAPTRGGADEIVHLDIAFPLDGDDSIDGVQILLESKRSF